MTHKLPLFIAFSFIFLFSVKAQDNNQTLLNPEPTSAYITIYSIFDVNQPSEMQMLDGLAQKYQGQKVHFVAITDKVNSNARKVIDSHTLHYTQLPQKLNHQVFNTYQTSMMKIFPIHIIVDGDGGVVYKKKGRSNSIDEKLDKKIDKLLKKYPDYARDETLLTERN